MRVLVLGGGIAGLTAALHAHEAGHEVVLALKGALGDGSTALAQGGIAGVYRGDDSPSAHASDTLAAGAGLSDPAAVDALVGDAAERIAELVARGVAFDRDADGRLLLGREAAHSAARIAHAGGDATGAAISRALCARVRETRIAVREHAFLLDLERRADGAVGGARMLLDGRATVLTADRVVLATGGAGQLFRHTTNPAGATGDGVAAALRVGAAVADLEFVQFHPTILATAGPAFLVSEAVRGEGATLIDDDGHRFVLDVHPDGELAPRDVVARAIARRAEAQGAPVRLDATALGAERLAARFPTIDRVTRERGLDWARAPIPVTPAAHYLMGGVVTDLDGRTTVPGLFAVGEVARTGVHGANRLASNSLLEGAVFGARAAAALGTPTPRHLAPTSPLAPVTPLERTAAIAPLDADHDAALPSDLRIALQDLMWEHVGLLRTVDGLSLALRTVRGWRAALPAPTVQAEHEDANLLLIAEAMTAAALARPVAVGAHHIDAARTGALIGV
ncbi:L-aspartate oxidase [Microbacterium resistens]|uniref:L-aspartate oxidase n=1 Tax=Microbacterium resistens TaxID=156977 RepID=A0ABU1S9S1_9MICO|nr:L-aspartate oxidase [Microbacterium resistens]MDR6865567.1 L-aspartate oxidase [Microbacterium resistens]